MSVLTSLAAQPGAPPESALRHLGPICSRAVSQLVRCIAACLSTALPIAIARPPGHLSLLAPCSVSHETSLEATDPFPQTRKHLQRIKCSSAVRRRPSGAGPPDGRGPGPSSDGSGGPRAESGGRRDAGGSGAAAGDGTSSRRSDSEARPSDADRQPHTSDRQPLTSDRQPHTSDRQTGRDPGHGRGGRSGHGQERQRGRGSRDPLGSRVRDRPCPFRQGPPCCSPRPHPAAALLGSATTCPILVLLPLQAIWSLLHLRHAVQCFPGEASLSCSAVLRTTAAATKLHVSRRAMHLLA